MAAVFLTSDLHLGHEFLAELRGFDSVADHDEAIMTHLTESLEVGDRLWILGDLSRGRPEDEEHALGLLGAALPGVEKHLVPGNHDSCHPLFRRAYHRQRMFLEVFDSVSVFQRVTWGGEDVYLSHFPRPGQDHPGMPSRFDELRLRVPLLVHGHLHSDFPVTGRGQVDVGVDAWDLRPVPVEVVHRTLSTSLDR
ncbi:metallophosphoesterase [Corynebacterium pacaense]|uniref:metallophosphoesterase n=1 Tax=Corynebacterium pacaense TaxID=1816684 RepID=UPI0009BBF9BC|nr:metallophosphoesterase [Corynebacterium pacaense]